MEQLDLALKQKDGNFYERSGAEARSRELKAELVELKKDKKYDPSDRERPFASGPQAVGSLPFAS